MRICHIITTFGYGGAEKLLLELVNIQCKNNQVYIIYLKNEPLFQSNLNPLIRLIRIELRFDCARNIRKTITDLDIEVVHTHLGHADLIGLWACRGIKVKRFCTMHNIWFKWNWVDRVIFHIYAIFFKTIAKDCRVICISRAVANHCKTRLRVLKSNIVLLHNAIADRSVFKEKNLLKEELGISQSDFCLLFVGRLEIQKSVDTLLYAVSEVKNEIPNLKVLLLGEGSLKLELKELVWKLGINETILFVGNAHSERYFEAADVFVLPSIFEGFGIVIIEAFRASLPVIATAIEGPQELIDDEVNGLLFEPKDYIGLSKKIVKLYGSPELRKNIGLRGYQSYAGKYRIEDYAEKIQSLYLE